MRRFSEWLNYLAEWLHILFSTFSTGTGCSLFLTIAVIAGVFFKGAGVLVVMVAYALLMGSLIGAGFLVDHLQKRHRP